MPKPQYIDCRLLDFVAELVTADENAANLSRIKLLESLAETWLLKQPRRGCRQRLYGSGRSPPVDRREKVV
ncbi:hypothetical protein AS890_00770 [Rhizobium anhuiense bv. trifolii]|jgi:hypothetical protein|nr:hypothetical protein AS890_00770 [Rhizobium anhuiense bv. trifolii]